MSEFLHLLGDAAKHPAVRTLLEFVVVSCAMWALRRVRRALSINRLWYRNTWPVYSDFITLLQEFWAETKRLKTGEPPVQSHRQ